MANPKSKILPEIFAVFATVLLFQCVDAFYPALMGDISTFGTNVVGSALGIIIVLISCFAGGRGLFDIGLSLRPIHFLKGFLSGGILMLLPMAIVLGFQKVLHIFLKIEALEIFFVPPNSDGTPSVTNIAVFAVSCAVTAFMQELFFRGYIIRSMRPTYPFFDANVVQAAFSAVFPLVLVIRNLLYGYYDFKSGFDKTLFLIVIILFYIVYSFIASVKRGLLARVDGNIWPSVFDNFFSMFLGCSLFVGTNIITSYSAVIKLSAVQVISLLFTYIYYHKQYVKNKKRFEKRHEENLRNLQQEFLQENDPNLLDISQRSVKDIVSDYNKQMIDSIGIHGMKAEQSNQDDNLIDLNNVTLDDNVEP